MGRDMLVRRSTPFAVDAEERHGVAAVFHCAASPETAEAGGGLVVARIGPPGADVRRLGRRPRRKVGQGCRVGGHSVQQLSRADLVRLRPAPLAWQAGDLQALRPSVQRRQGAQEHQGLLQQALPRGREGRARQGPQEASEG